MSDRGFIDWRPSGESLARVDMIIAILAEYREHLPLTMRQVFYRAVGQYGYDKTERSYKRLLYVAAKARRAHLIDFDHVRDDGVTVNEAPGFDGVADLEGYLRDIARTYRRKRLASQRQHIILLCEAAGMVPQIARVAHEYGVDVRSSGGFDSVTAKYELANYVVAQDKPVTLLHIGDLDPSGESIFEVIRDDVGAFVHSANCWPLDCFRLAVTRRQAEDMRLPTTPAKETDSRARNFKGETVQCEAIPPDALNEIVRSAIRSRLDGDAFDADIAAETAEREHIGRIMTQVSFTTNGGEGRA